MSGATETDLYDSADTIVNKLLQFSPVFVSKADQLRKTPAIFAIISLQE